MADVAALRPGRGGARPVRTRPGSCRCPGYSRTCGRSARMICRHFSIEFGPCTKFWQCVLGELRLGILLRRRCGRPNTWKRVRSSSRDPASHADLPDRMPIQEAADDADADRFARRRRRSDLGRAVAVGHDPRRQPAEDALQVAVVVALVGEEERLAPCRGPSTCRRECAPLRRPRGAPAGAARSRRVARRSATLRHRGSAAPTCTTPSAPCCSRA